MAMTKNEAAERAVTIWGSKAVVTLAVPHSEGVYWVDVGNRSHRLDANGHATCHAECAKIEGGEIGPITFQIRLWCNRCSRVVGDVGHVPDNDPRGLVSRAMVEHVVTTHPDPAMLGQAIANLGRK